jgi:hypothetical protein
MTWYWFGVAMLLLIGIVGLTVSTVRKHSEAKDAALVDQWGNGHVEVTDEVPVDWQEKGWA